MYCIKCGTANQDNALRCVKCNEIIHNLPPPLAPPRPPAPSIADDPAMRLLLPVGRSGLAIAAGYAGLFAFLIAPAPIALALGILAIRDLKRNPKKHGMGRAIFGTAIGALGTIGLLLILIAR